jgi:hypothetical protein
MPHPACDGTLLFLVPGSRTKGSSAASRDFYCYLGDLLPSGLRLRVLKRPDQVGPPHGVDPALIIPAAPKRVDPDVLADVIGGAGSALMHLVLGAATFHPPFAIDRERDARIVARIDRQLAGTPLALTADDQWAAFQDLPSSGSRARGEHLLLRPVVVPGSLEWAEFHVFTARSSGRRVSVEPLLHIPLTSVVDQWRREAPENLVLLTGQIERLLRRLARLLARAA